MRKKGGARAVRTPKLRARVAGDDGRAVALLPVA
jgi:hypothetical protein